MRCIILISIIIGVVICSNYVEARANSHQRQPISETSGSVEDDDNDFSSEEFEKYRRATVSVLLDSDSTETTDQLLMRAKLLAYVDKLKAKEAKKKLKAQKKAAKEAAFLAAFAAQIATTTMAPEVTTAESTTPESSEESEEESVEVTTTANPVKAARATFNVTVSDSAETSDDLLMRAKLISFMEKLKAKQAKKDTKAKLKAEKDKAFIAMFLAANNATAPTPASAGAPAKRQIAAGPASASDLLAQAKLDAYVAKLKAKQEKAKVKAEKKAAKAKMFAAYLAQAANASAAGVAPAPIVPFPGAVGLFNKSMFLNGLFTAMANANAAAAAAAAAANTTPQPAVVAAVDPPAPAVPDTETEVEAEPETELNEISKRHAPRNWDEESVEESEESPEVPEAPVADAPVAPIAPRYRPKQSAAYKAARPLSNRDQQILDFWAKYNQDAGVESAERAEVIPSRRTDIGNRHKPGATNDFKTGPAGSPNGVGYAESPVSQAGCSGSHIHSCSGMTVYINKPEGEDNKENGKDASPKPKKHHHHKGKFSKRALALNKIPAA